MRKQLAYDLQSTILSNTGISRAQTLEVIARVFGFNSLSHLDSQGLLVHWPAELAKDQFLAKPYEDQFSTLSEPITHSAAINFICDIKTDDNIDSELLISRVLDVLKARKVMLFHFSDFYNLDLSYDELKLLSECFLQACDSRNPNTLLGVAEFFMSFIDEEALDNDYWAQQLNLGKSLSEPALTFAKAYNFSIECKNLASELLLSAAEQNQPEAMYALSKWPFQDQSASWLVKAAESGHREAIIDIAYQTDPEVGGIGPWTEKAALLGSFHHVVEMAEQALDSDSEANKNDAYYWYELGRCHGFDITRSEVDNDEDYGPINITFEGVRLPETQEAILETAKRNAQKTYNRLENQDLS